MFESWLRKTTYVLARQRSVAHGIGFPWVSRISMVESSGEPRRRAWISRSSR